MPVEDDPDDALGARLPLPADDRLWRHPSEVAWPPPATTIADPPGRAPRLWSVAAAAAVTGAVLAISVVALLGVPGQRADRPVAERAGPRFSLDTATTVASFDTVASAPTPESTIPDGTITDIRPSVWMGIEGTDVALDRVAALQPHSGGGIVVVTVRTASPAEAAGVQPGDVVIAIDGTEVATLAGLVDHLRSRTPGESVVLTVVRDGATMFLPLTLVPR